jgi:hypothetical protein
MARLTGEALAAWVEASCARHGVPVKVTDPAAVRSVVVLLSGRAERRGRGRVLGVAGSEAPDEIDSVRVEGAARSTGGGDDGMVEDRLDDRGLPSEVEVGPLSA